VKYILVIIVALTVLLSGGVATAQTTPTCPPVEGITCDGWVTDTANVIANDAALESQVGEVVAEYGHEIAVVVVPDSGSLTPNELAREIGSTWGVGSAQNNDGVVILVDLANRWIAIETGSGIDVTNSQLDDLTSLAAPYFQVGDFDGGISAMLNGLGDLFSGGNAPPSTIKPLPTTPTPQPSENPVPGIVLGALVLGTGVALVTTGSARSRRDRAALEKKRRKDLVDGELARLRPSGQELTLPDELTISPPATAPSATTADAIRALRALQDGSSAAPQPALEALWVHRAIDVFDKDKLSTEIPLELRVTGEQPVLEDSLQQTTNKVLNAPDDATFEVARSHLRSVVDALRPYRIAEARRKMAISLSDSAVCGSSKRAPCSQQRILSKRPSR
jgi:uncharacterized membrane protein YgcG